MGEYQCPRCGNVIYAPDARSVRCGQCGFGQPAGQAVPSARPTTGVGYHPTPPAPAPQAFTPAPPAGYGVYGPPPVQAPPPVAYAYPPPVPKQANPMGIASLVLGILPYCMVWFLFVNPVAPLFTLVPGAGAIVLGALGIQKVNKNPIHMGGKGLSISGLTLGIIYVAAFLIIYLFYMMAAANLARMRE